MNFTQLDGKAALVTGAASGIGRAIAETLAQAGAFVVVTDRDGTGAEKVARQIAADGGAAVAAQVDVVESDQLAAAVALAEESFGRLDSVFCNAGLVRDPVPAAELDEATFDQIFAVNVKGAWLTARAAVPALRRAGGGTITITGSIMGERTRPGFAAYASSKAASNHLARSLALELADDNIRVNSLAPVATDTAMLPIFLGSGDQDEARARFIGSIPLGRLATPQDVAGAAAFLASDAAAFVTGVVLPVDGGRNI
ncbi:glucose 1-dehydrogenase [Streptomyces sp. NPDC096354]|uniref:glucose 1-dehydrogenase n=1 Tax=Streptomyces sp. NPDC096354 TaxID=3366088 RepID=UPI00381ADC30